VTGLRGLAAGGRPALLVLLGVSLLLRLLVPVLLGPYEWFAGGDGPWYVQLGWAMANGAHPSPPRTAGPVYPLVLGGIWQAFPGHPSPAEAMAIPVAYLTTVRLVQALVGTATVALVFALARRLDLGPAPSLAAAAAVGVGPAFVIEPFMVRTETLFIAALAGLAILQVRCQRGPTPGRCAAAGAAAALVALIRPLMLPLPIALALLIVADHRSRQASRGALALVAAAALLLAPWHLWLHRETGLWLPEGFGANLFIGAQGRGAPLERAEFHDLADDLTRRGRGYLGGAVDLIAERPLDWLASRGWNFATAVAQPHGTSDLGGPSVKAALAGWAAEDRSARGLWQVLATRGFALRVAIYGAHYAALVFGLAGAWLTWGARPWRPVHALLGCVALIPAILVVVPRYLFPAQTLLWVLAAAWLWRSHGSGIGDAAHAD
jgi:hypothetical protein